MAQSSNLLLRLTERRIKTPDDKILFPDQWYDESLPFLVGSFGEIIPVNRVVAMFCFKKDIPTGEPTSKIFWIDETSTNYFDQEDCLETREEVQKYIEDNDIEPVDKVWWELQGCYRDASYDYDYRLKEGTGWASTISDMRSKNHHIWYLMWNDPLKLEYIEPGGNDEIWGEIGEVDYNDLISF